MARNSLTMLSMPGHYSDKPNLMRILVFTLLINCSVVSGSRGIFSSISSTASNDGNVHTNSIQYRNSAGNTTYHSSQNIANTNLNNLLMIGLSSCQTVCACKWKGGKQTVECIDRALITIPENIDASTQVLDMSGNNLQILPHEQFIRANLLNLQRLFLRNCRLGQIDNEAFKGLTNLVELDLSHNLLTAIPSITLSYIPSLRDLTLASNPVQKIESNTFRTIPSLTKLDLSHCDIQMVAPQAFEGLEALHSLKLNGNKLSELRPRTVETLSRLHGVELHDNPWLCDCRLRAAKIWLTANNIPYPVAPICSGGPERIIDRTFAELHVDDFACRPEMLPVNHYVESVAGDNATITCRSSAVPAGNVNWYWNGRLLLNGSTFSTYQKVYVYEDGQFEKRSRLVLTNSQETDSSEFYCVAENRAGTAEANFTLHVAMRAAGMASLGSGQIVGLSAALVILILFILLIILFLLIRLKRTPFIESKTPNHLEVITAVNQQNTINCKQPSSISNMGAGPLSNSLEVNCMDHKIGNNITDSIHTNPVQKPPRLTDLSYTTSNYDNNGSVLQTAPAFSSPTASAGNNPDLINDTKRFGSTEFADLKIPSALTTKDCLDPLSVAANLIGIDRPGSGEYSRAGGCDSLYPSGLWETGHHHPQSDDLYLKRATSTTIPGYNYTDKTPIIDNTPMYDLHERSTEYFSRTFPRTHFGTLSASAQSTIPDGSGSTTTTATTLSASLAGSVEGSGYPSDYGLPLVPGAEQRIQHQHPFQQFNNNNNISATSTSNNNNNSNKLGTLSSTPPASSSSTLTTNHLPAMLHNSMPINAKTIRVWQKGGVPVLPPVSALKRALISSSRNSPDEGYQEGCGTDV